MYDKVVICRADKPTADLLVKISSLLLENLKVSVESDLSIVIAQM